MEFKQKRAMTEADSELFQYEASRHVSNCGTPNVILTALYTIIPKGDFYSQPFWCYKKIIHVLLRGLSVKFEDTVNTEAKTSNNMESFLFILLRTI